MRSSKNLTKPKAFQGFWDMQPSWNLLSSSRPHHATFKKPRKTVVFDQIWLFGGILAIFCLNSGGPGLPGMMVEIDFRPVLEQT